MDTYGEHRNHGLLIGLLAGTCVGMSLALWLAPRSASEVRQRMVGSARALVRRASAQYPEAGRLVADTVDEFRGKMEGVRDDIAGAVTRGVRAADGYATAPKSEPAGHGETA
jgi:gas vesicle protein